MSIKRRFENNNVNLLKGVVQDKEFGRFLEVAMIESAKSGKLTTTLINNDSNVQNFINRLNDKSNWLTQYQEEELMDHDCNNDR